MKDHKSALFVPGRALMMDAGKYSALMRAIVTEATSMALRAGGTIEDRAESVLGRRVEVNGEIWDINELQAEMGATLAMMSPEERRALGW